MDDDESTPMKQLNIREAKAKLSSIVDQAARVKASLLRRPFLPVRSPSGKMVIKAGTGKLNVDFDRLLASMGTAGIRELAVTWDMPWL